ncbi:DUF7003 family protein [Pseudobacter ginsenosidimutans]|uniref:Uncharacterized protein n=1 Tax=Pseudobacter ginsenosidimutans TaxID=661488 RepID=A0A4V2F151_9BACT|nr:hypothetical protein [Pseudobacter ginsenosidimutans]QEC40857.1 hypothetical protein FSB84_03780 [Pseudobacter ginsenosidimutans]RZS72411.1 hypothetical protein EV199_4331 [Pseudobacter ginsenosidimutans]
MITEGQILAKLDDYKLGYYCQFVELGHVYSYLIDSRLNIFKGDNDSWAIAAERLGYNPRGSGITLDICFFGNCLTNLEHYNGQDTNYYTVSPIEWNDFNDTVDGEVLKPDAKFWTIRGIQIELSHKKQDYLNAGIELNEYEPDEISLEEVGRLLITKHRNLFRATDEELYKSIPNSLKKILVIDEWYHRDFTEIVQPTMSDEQLRSTYDFNKNLAGGEYPLNYETFASMFRQQEKLTSKYNQNQYQDNRPSSYETWQLIAKVIATGDTTLYKPTLKPNTHWKNWPDSGSL